ncbi:flagellar filament capping protein FliD [Maridesulfovibrio zosterae]|uniref:flagellar filament capping protein FliD n=1 Tax=Maridesulfovibrio zosterae TaxID=82171 RepID=UPI00040092A5|nr:flagellar filament capping protein FliD [Maridesulfovibrio zosterae]
MVSSITSSSYTSNTNSGSFTIDGLGNGTDWSALIEATIEGESYKKEQYEADLEDAESAVTLLTALDEELIGLSTTLQGIDELDEFLSYKGSVSGDEVTATVENGAGEGSYNLIVNQLAKKDVWIAESYDIADAATSIASSDSSITLSYSGKDITIAIAAGTTAQELIDQINSNAECDGKINASLVSDGTNYHLKFAGEDTGKDNAIVIKDLSALDSVNPADFTNTQTAQNAQIKIDGYPSGANEWMERASNSLDDVIDNMTVALNSTTDGDGVTIGVTYDTAAMTETIESFVSSVNQILYDVLDLTGALDTGADDEGTFYLKDSSLGMVNSQIKNVLSTMGVGFQRYDSDTGEGDLFTTLSTIGISTDSDEGSSTFGQLEIDYDELEEALSEDPKAVAMLFAASGEAKSSNSSVQILSTISGLTSGGEYDVEYTVSGGAITSATINGNEMKINGSTLLAQSDSDANGLYLQITDLTDGTYSSTVTIQQGKCGQLADLCTAMTDVDSGAVPLLIESYETLTGKLEDEIYDEEARLDSLESSLTRKYAALDEMLSYYTGLQSQLETTLSTDK